MVHNRPKNLKSRFHRYQNALRGSRLRQQLIPTAKKTHEVFCRRTLSVVMQNHPAVRRKQYILVSTQQDKVKDCFGHNCFSQKYFAEKNFAKKYSTKKYYAKKYFADKYVGVLVSIKMKCRTALVTISVLFHLQLPTEAIKKPYVETYWESWIPGVRPKILSTRKNPDGTSLSV